MTRLTLFSRQYCHLCHEMRAQLDVLAVEFSFELEVLDVDTDPELEARYNELVPVLSHGSLELARYRLDHEALRAYLTKIR